MRLFDDTSCTNQYFLPVIALIAEDELGSNQVMSFTITNRRPKEDFIAFLVL